MDVTNVEKLRAKCQEEAQIMPLTHFILLFCSYYNFRIFTNLCS